MLHNTKVDNHIIECIESSGGGFNFPSTEVAMPGMVIDEPAHGIINRVVVVFKVLTLDIKKVGVGFSYCWLNLEE